MYFVYIVHSVKLDKFYIGYTADIQDRLSKHNRSKKGFTSNGKPWELVYSEEFDTKKEALLREAQLKAWKNKDRIISLIKNKKGA